MFIVRRCNVWVIAESQEENIGIKSVQSADVKRNTEKNNFSARERERER